MSQIVFFWFLFQSVSLCSTVWSETHRNPTRLCLPSARIKGLQPHTWHNSMLFKECFDSAELVFKGQVSGSWFWWHIVVISALRSLRKYSKFQARWGYMLALSKNKIYKILQTWNLNVNVNVTGAFFFRKAQCIIKDFSDRCINLKTLLSLFHQFKIVSIITVYYILLINNFSSLITVLCKASCLYLSCQVENLATRRLNEEAGLRK